MFRNLTSASAADKLYFLLFFGDRVSVQAIAEDRDMFLSSAIACDHDRRIADDHRRVFPYDRKRSQIAKSSAIVCDHMETLFCDRLSAFTTVTVKISKTKTKRLTAGKKTGRNINLLAAKFPPRHPPCCLLRFSHQNNAHVIF